MTSDGADGAWSRGLGRPQWVGDRRWEFRVGAPPLTLGPPVLPDSLSTPWVKSFPPK